MKYSFLVVVLLCALAGCTDHCPKRKKDKTPTVVDHGSLPDSLKNVIPYHHGETVKYKHNNGHVVSFSIERSTEKVTSPCYWCCENIETDIYEVENTYLEPDYLLFDISLSMNNYKEAMRHFVVKVGVSEFEMPFDYGSQNTVVYDTLTINSQEYLNVIKVGNSTNYSSSLEIYPVSIYYNRSHGIVKILMSNEEYYELEE